MNTRHFAIAALVLIGASASTLAQKGKPAPTDVFYPATLTFSDRAGDAITDAITSDGAGAYVNGGQTELGFHSVTNDLVMRGDSGSRFVTFDSTTPVPPTGPGGVSNEFDVFMNIRGILNMAPGSSRTTTARVSGFRFNPTNYQGTTTVDVFRDDAGVWTITADGADIAALVQVVRGKEKVMGHYYMPFQITVVCPSCS